jgi:hypothetical protein
MALAAAKYSIESIGVKYGSPPWCSVAFTLTPAGALFSK